MKKNPKDLSNKHLVNSFHYILRKLNAKNISEDTFFPCYYQLSDIVDEAESRKIKLVIPQWVESKYDELDGFQEPDNEWDYHD